MNLKFKKNGRGGFARGVGWWGYAGVGVKVQQPNHDDGVAPLPPTSPRPNMEPIAERKFKVGCRRCSGRPPVRPLSSRLRGGGGGLPLVGENRMLRSSADDTASEETERLGAPPRLSGYFLRPGYLEPFQGLAPTPAAVACCFDSPRRSLESLPALKYQWCSCGLPPPCWPSGARRRRLRIRRNSKLLAWPAKSFE